MGLVSIWFRDMTVVSQLWAWAQGSWVGVFFLCPQTAFPLRPLLHGRLVCRKVRPPVWHFPVLMDVNIILWFLVLYECDDGSTSFPTSSIVISNFSLSSGCEVLLHCDFNLHCSKIIFFFSTSFHLQAIYFLWSTLFKCFALVSIFKNQGGGGAWRQWPIFLEKNEQTKRPCFNNEGSAS